MATLTRPAAWTEAEQKQLETLARRYPSSEHSLVTQCAKIAARYGYEHVSAGDLLRAEVARGSTDGATIERLIRNGQLVPDDLTLKVIQRAISRSASNAFLLDGYPRTMKQALAFEHGIDDVTRIAVAESYCEFGK